MVSNKVLVFIGVAVLAVTLALLGYTAHRNSKNLENYIKASAQTSYIRFYVNCRSQGRTRKQCRKIAKGIILEPRINVKQLDAKLARISEGIFTKLTVTGPKGKSGNIGNRGPRGSKGPQGLRGAKGDQGSQGKNGTNGRQGNNGTRGAQGSQGSQGPRGLPGPAGAQGPAGVVWPTPCTITLVRIPSIGSGYICLVSSTPESEGR